MINYDFQKIGSTHLLLLNIQLIPPSPNSTLLFRMETQTCYFEYNRKNRR